MSATSVTLPRPADPSVDHAIQAIVGGASTAETCFVSTYWWDVAGAKRSGLHTAWVARRERSLLDTVPAPDYRGRDLAEVADAIVDGLAD